MLGGILRPRDGRARFPQGAKSHRRDPHVHYYNRQYGYSLRPAREGAPDHDPYAPGLHHFCFRVIDEVAVNRAARELGEAGVEVTNFREKRRRLMYDWEAREDL